ncbi:MAG: hypothetical protein ACXVIK_07415 [Halobacteriota archaeon]
MPEEGQDAITGRHLTRYEHEYDFSASERAVAFQRSVGRGIPRRLPTLALELTEHNLPALPVTVSRLHRVQACGSSALI